MTHTPSPERIAAAEKYLDGDLNLRDAGSLVNATEQVMKTTVAWVRGYRQAIRENTMIDGMSASAKEKAASYTRRLEREFQSRVLAAAQRLHGEWMRERIDTMLADQKRLRERLTRALGQQQKMTAADYKTLRMVLHPDTNASPDMRAKAWAIFDALELEPMSKTDEKKLTSRSETLAKMQKVAAGL